MLTARRMRSLDKNIRRIQRDARAWNGAVVYFVLAESVGKVKIGRSTTFDQRIGSLRTSSPVPLSVLGTIEGANSVEKWCHAQCERDHSHLEWFDWTSRTRAFVELVLAHGKDAARRLCPYKHRSDFLVTEGRRSGYGVGLGDVAVGDACQCDLCLLYASLVNESEDPC